MLFINKGGRTPLFKGGGHSLRKGAICQQGREGAILHERELFFKQGRELSVEAEVLFFKQ